MNHSFIMAWDLPEEYAVAMATAKRIMRLGDNAADKRQENNAI
jgi:hypothetical protein